MGPLSVLGIEDSASEPPQNALIPKTFEEEVRGNEEIRIRFGTSSSILCLFALAWLAPVGATSSSSSHEVARLTGSDDVIKG